MSYTRFLLLGAALLGSSCGHRFRAASPANVVSDSPNVARAAAQGLSMDVEIDAWSGDPASLGSILTPVKISLTNEGDHAVSLRYQNFTLSDPRGVRSSAIPPFQIRGSTDPLPAPIVPSFSYRNFYAYPYYRFYGPGFNYWADDWGWDGAWYGSSYRYWSRDLPTADMVRKAIPEGVLNPGGEVSGYLYFPLLAGDSKTVELQAVLMDANTHQQFGVLNIPFVRK